MARLVSCNITLLKSFDFKDLAKVNIGRKPNNHIQVSNIQVSGYHCNIIKKKIENEEENLPKTQ